MKLIYCLLFLLLLSRPVTYAQIGINGQPHPSAALDLNSPGNNKGLLIPRLNSQQRTSLPNPATGLLVFDSTTNSFWFYNGTVWTPISGSTKVKSVYIPGNGLSYSPSANITQNQYGLSLTNTAGQVCLIVPKPVDWDSTLAFTITLHFSLPSNTTNTFLRWRLLPGGMTANTTSGNANTGWDSYDYYTTEDAPLLIAYSVSNGYTNLSKSQSWTPKWSSTYNTWYFGATNSVTVANSFSSNSIWRFGFQRGTAVSNGETYSGNMVINGVTITYKAK